MVTEIMTFVAHCILKSNNGSSYQFIFISLFEFYLIDLKRAELCDEVAKTVQWKGSNRCKSKNIRSGHMQN